MIICGNNMEELKVFEDNTFDSIVTDPPYGISFMNKKWDYDVPSVDFWKEALRVLKHGGHILVACGTRTQHRMAVNIEEAGFEIRDIVAWVYASGFPKSKNVALAVDKGEGMPNRGHRIAVANRFHPDGTEEPNGEALEPYVAKTDLAKPWEGWGTALKPAMELWTLARKPLDGTVANNIVNYGVGGINVDGCRLEVTDPIAVNVDFSDELQSEGWGVKKAIVDKQYVGRFPANFIHDNSDEVVELLPNAARFFYTPKPNRKERDMGLFDFDEQEVRGGGGRVEQGYDENDEEQQRLRRASTAFGAVKSKKKNVHPTVKPVELMRYLVRLITPKGGIVLDPYLGSGTTAVAAKLEGIDCVGIELEPEYAKIAESRVAACDTNYDAKEQMIKGGATEVFDIFDFDVEKPEE
jgi:DNA modification methylase